MAAAEAPMALPTLTPAGTPGAQAAGEPVAAAMEEMVRLVGSKTFVMRDGVWMDTAYDADRQTPQEVGFASDAYFDLLTAVPELGQYLAIGEQVLVVYEDQVYQIVPGEGDAAITLPQDPSDRDSGFVTTETITSDPELASTRDDFVTSVLQTEGEWTNLPSWLLWTSLGILLMIVVVLAGKLAGKRP
jgi:hypothetical protein